MFLNMSSVIEKTITKTKFSAEAQKHTMALLHFNKRNSNFDLDSEKGNIIMVLRFYIINALFLVDFLTFISKSFEVKLILF